MQKDPASVLLVSSDPARSTLSKAADPRRWSPVVLVALTALAGCGGHDDSNDSPAPIAVTPAASAPLRTSLNAAGSNGNLIEARTSQAPTLAGAAPSTVYDDFRLTTAGTVASVAWQGIYCVQANGAGAPAPTASQFIVAIYADSAGRPALGTPLATTTVTATAAGQTFERNFPGLSCGAAANTTWALYDYRAALGTPLALAANTTYWVSVQAVTPSYDVYWGWRAGTADNNLSLIRFQGVYDVLTFDRSYSLVP